MGWKLFPLVPVLFHFNLHIKWSGNFTCAGSGRMWIQGLNRASQMLLKCSFMHLFIVLGVTVYFHCSESERENHRLFKEEIIYCYKCILKWMWANTPPQREQSSSCRLGWSCSFVQHMHWIIIGWLLLFLIRIRVSFLLTD